MQVHSQGASATVMQSGTPAVDESIPRRLQLVLPLSQIYQMLLSPLKHSLSSYCRIAVAAPAVGEAWRWTIGWLGVTTFLYL